MEDDDRLVAAQKRVRLIGDDATASTPTRRRLAAQVPSLQDLCLGVLVPGIVARGDRFFMKNLGSDIAMLVFQRLKRDRALTGNTMKLFMHCSLPRVDLSDYSNATREFLDSVASMSFTLTSLSLANCHLVADFEQLHVLRRLTVLDLSGCQLRDKALPHLRPLHGLLVLRLARSKITTAGANTALRWFPQLQELDLSGLDLTDACVGALRQLTALELLALAGNNFQVLRLNPLKRLQSLTLADCNGLRPESLYWLGGCTALTALDLTRASSLTGKSLFQLRVLTRLEMLQLPPSSAVEPEAFGLLSTLTRLRALNVPRYAVEDLSFAANMAALQSVNLAACAVTDLRPLRGKNNLTALNLQSCRKIGDESIEALQHVPNLASLNISKTAITDMGCVALAQCRALVQLSLEGCDVGDSGLAHFATSLQRLQLLDVRGTRITREELTMLQPLKMLMQVRFDEPHAPGGPVHNDDADDHDGE